MSFLMMENKEMYDLIKSEKIAALSTDYKGTPFGSLVPYALDANGNPVIFISTLATHTKNLVKKSECSVMMQKIDHDDVFNSARVTLIGKMEKVTNKEEITATRKIFFDRFPNARNFEELHDFDFYRMKIDKVYYIGGFGDINWITAESYYKNFGDK